MTDPDTTCPECGDEAGVNTQCRLCVVHGGVCKYCEDATGGICERHFDHYVSEGPD